MRTVSQPFLPTIPDIEDKSLKNYLVSLEQALRRMSSNVHSDLDQGNSRFRQRSTVPAVSALDNGQMTFVVSGALEYLVARVSGANYTVAKLSALP